MGIIALVVPAAVTVGDPATPEPTFDIGVAPSAIGGRLTVSGDRSGAMELDTATGIGGRYQVEGDDVIIAPAAEPVLSGPNGRVAFDRDTGDVKLIEFEDLALYLDPGACTVTEGATNEAAGLMAALVDCPDVADVRGRGEVTITGVLALPIEVIRGRGDLPPSGGTVVVVLEDEVDRGEELSITFDEAELFLDGEPDDDGLITAGSFTEQGGLAVEYDPAAEDFYLVQVSVGDYYALTSEPCPIATQDLGRISETTRVVRLEIDCAEMTDVDGQTVSVAGTIVADLVEGLLEEP
jgi:hypothetical protein